MAGSARLVYELLRLVGSGIIGTGIFAAVIYLTVAIIAGIAVYGVLIIVTRTVTMEDMKLVPRGEKLARILRVRE